MDKDDLIDALPWFVMTFLFVSMTLNTFAQVSLRQRFDVIERRMQQIEQQQGVSEALLLRSMGLKREDAVKHEDN